MLTRKSGVCFLFFGGFFFFIFSKWLLLGGEGRKVLPLYHNGTVKINLNKFKTKCHPHPPGALILLLPPPILTIPAPLTALGAPLPALLLPPELPPPSPCVLAARAACLGMCPAPPALSSPSTVGPFPECDGLISDSLLAFPVVRASGRNWPLKR